MSDPQGYNGSFIDEEAFIAGLPNWPKKSTTTQEQKQIEIVPQPGHIITIFFRNGVQLEGEVVFWSDQKSILKSPTGIATIVIQKTLDDIMFYKFSDVKNDYENLIEKPIKEEDDIKRLAELKGELNNLERAEIRERMRSHIPDAMRKVSYGLSNCNIKIEGAVKRPGEEITRTSSNIGTELQGMFSKKH
jgi:hypothetical protein